MPDEVTAVDLSPFPDGTPFVCLKPFRLMTGSIVHSVYRPGLAYVLTPRNRSVVAIAVADGGAKIGAEVRQTVKARVGGTMRTG